MTNNQPNPRATDWRKAMQSPVRRRPRPQTPTDERQQLMNIVLAKSSELTGRHPLFDDAIQEMAEMVADFILADREVTRRLTKRKPYTPRKSVEGWHLRGKQVNDMDREELLDFIEYIAAELVDAKRDLLTQQPNQTKGR